MRIVWSTSAGPDPRLGRTFPVGPVDVLKAAAVDGRRVVVTVSAGHYDGDCDWTDRHDCAAERLQVVDLESGRLLRSVHDIGGLHLATAVALGRTYAVVAGEWTTTARLVDLADGVVRHLPESRDIIGDVAAAPDRPIAVIAGLDGEIRLIDLTDGEVRHINAGEPARAVAVVAGVIAVGGAGLTLFDLESGARLGTLPVTFEVRALAAYDDGLALAVLGRDGEAEAWDVRAATRIFGLSGAAGGANAVAGVLTAGGDRLLAVAADDAVQLWDVDDRSLVGPPLTGPTGGRALCPAGPGTLVTTSDTTSDTDESIAVWKVGAEPPAPGGAHSSTIRRLAVAGDRIYAAGVDDTVAAWRLADGHPDPTPPEKSIDFPAPRPAAPPAEFGEWIAGHVRIDGRPVAVTWLNNELSVHDLETGTTRTLPTDTAQTVTLAAAVDAERPLLAICRRDGTVSILDLTTGATLGDLPLPGPATALTWASGTRLAIACRRDLLLVAVDDAT